MREAIIHWTKVHVEDKGSSLAHLDSTEHVIKQRGVDGYHLDHEPGFSSARALHDGAKLAVIPPRKVVVGEQPVIFLQIFSKSINGLSTIVLIES